MIPDDMDELVIREKAETINDLFAAGWLNGYNQADRNWREKIETRRNDLLAVAKTDHKFYWLVDEFDKLLK